MDTIRNTTSKTWLDCLPIEIIFCIFDYLSNNDIIYAFFYFNQRFNNLLLQNQRYLNYLDLPTTHMSTWNSILSVIGSHVESLNINTIDLTFPLRYFRNLKSIIIPISDDLPTVQFKEIFESEHFIHLHSFKMKQSVSFDTFLYNKYLTNQNYVLEKVFSNKSSLKTFQYSLKITRSIIDANTNFKTNLNLHSLSLVLTDFKDIFKLISYTPNLKYLNLRAISISDPEPINKVNIKLKEFYFTLHALSFETQIFSKLVNFIKQFSSSLTCLSLNAFNSAKNMNEFPFNSFKLKQFLESMIELKQFHLYAAVIDGLINADKILAQFQDQYWFDRNLSFGMHKHYFYTLPFHFDYLYDLPNSFDNVKSNSPQILTNHRLWYNVKSIDLSARPKYDVDFVKELKMKMPKLTSIKFRSHHDYCVKRKENEREKIRMTLDNVTKIHYMFDSLEYVNEWLIYASPNLTHLRLPSTKLLLIDKQLGEILNKKIQQLDIDVHDGCSETSKTIYAYFSNVKYLNFYLHNDSRAVTWYKANLMKVSENCKNLQRLIICVHVQHDLLFEDPNFLIKLIKSTNWSKIMKNYQMKHTDNWILFSKQECPNANILSSTVLRILSFFHHEKI